MLPVNTEKIIHCVDVQRVNFRCVEGCGGDLKRVSIIGQALSKFGPKPRKDPTMPPPFGPLVLSTSKSPTHRTRGSYSYSLREDHIDDAPRYAEIRERKRCRHLRGAPVSKGCEHPLPCRFWQLIRYPWTARLHGRLGSRGALNGPQDQRFTFVGKKILVGQALAAYPCDYGTDDFHFHTLSQLGVGLQVACNLEVSAWNDSILLVL